ncbi:LemA family protein [Methanolapillus millepedarum]|uniref:LemA family protein n=1 Tax=Methanolapillus millepedarum TaxID=3028296 RepID=A0AA96V435_9EURY|nr:hypothetical protein MsAc7_13750 [Methanosarcinaceae archaeon Ac7]
MEQTWIIIIILAIIALIGFFTYRKLVKKHNEFTYYSEDVEKRAAAVDLQIEKQFDIIDSMARLLRQYDQKEYDFVKDVTAAKSGNVFQRAATMEMAMQKMYQVVEQTPTITATSMYKDLNGQIKAEAEKTMYSKRKYNTVASSYNKRISMIPYSFFAKTWGFEKKPLFKSSTQLVEEHSEGMNGKKYKSKEIFGSNTK